MSFQMRVKGTGVLIVGTLETIMGIALVKGCTPEGELVYSGETDVNWDSQTTEKADGFDIYMGEDGGQYLSRDCEPVES